MTDLEYLNAAEQALATVERACDRINDETDVDLDVQRSGGMLTLSFRDKSQVVVNLQKPLHEIWLAARTGGYHFRSVDGAWRDTKDGADFFSRLSECVSEHARRPLEIAASR